MNTNPNFEVLYTEEALQFLMSLNIKIREKILYNISKCRYVHDNELFKKITGTNIWEFRTLYNGVHYRLFAFWDSNINSLVVATHGIVKKTTKTPTKEIDKAETFRTEYFHKLKKDTTK